MVSSGCYRGINGKVVENATGKPLEGALIVVQWTRPDIHSIEGWSIEVIKNHEVLTDKDGVFTIKDTPMNPFANPPNMIIYKEGYIPWANDSIFPGKMKSEHEWKNNMTYKLDLFTNNFTARQLDGFLTIVHGGNELPMYNELMAKISRRGQAESEAQQKNKWLIEIKTLFESLDKGPHTWVHVRDKLTDKNFEMDWMLDEANKENSAVSIAMRECGIIVEHKPVGSFGDGSIYITKMERAQ
jgi:hypothetical protein